jgi:hypothetical protein
MCCYEDSKYLAMEHEGLKNGGEARGVGWVAEWLASVR